MLIEIINLNRDNEYIETSNENNLINLKNTFYKTYQISFDEQVWFYNNIMLTSSEDISKVNKLSLFIKNSFLTLQIEMKDKKIYKLPLINKNLLIKQLKKIIENKFNLTDFNIFKNNIKLEEKKEINDYHITENSILNIKKEVSKYQIT
jgi:hypothetical protein